MASQRDCLPPTAFPSTFSGIPFFIITISFCTQQGDGHHDRFSRTSFECLCGRRRLKPLQETIAFKNNKKNQLSDQLCRVLSQPKDKWVPVYRKWVWKEAEERHRAIGKVRGDVRQWRESGIGHVYELYPLRWLRLTPFLRFMLCTLVKTANRPRFQRQAHWTLKVPLDYCHFAWLI